MKRALLIGTAPSELEFAYVSEPPYDAVVIGSLTLGQLLRLSDERILAALAQGMNVYLYTPGLPPCPKKCIALLNAAGYRAYAVGGGVRDSLLGLAPKDYDLCTDATPKLKQIPA